MNISLDGNIWQVLALIVAVISLCITVYDRSKNNNRLKKRKKNKKNVSDKNEAFINIKKDRSFAEMILSWGEIFTNFIVTITLFSLYCYLNIYVLNSCVKITSNRYLDYATVFFFALCLFFIEKKVFNSAEQNIDLVKDAVSFLFKLVVVLGFFWLISNLVLFESIYVYGFIFS